MNAPSWGQADKAEPLARDFPADSLVVLFKHAGLESQPAAWKNSATYQMLNKTSLGAMFDDILGQLIDNGLRILPASPTTAAK